MIGCTVKESSRSGARGMRRRLRLASTSVSEMRVADAAHRSPSSPAPSSASAAWPVRREEDVVEGRAAQRHVVDPDPGLVEAAHGLGDRARALVDRHPQDAVGAAIGRSVGDRRQRRDRRLGVGLGPRGVTSSRSPPTWSLSSSELPSAITRPWSITAIRSARRSASSRYWVVSSTVVPSATRPSIVSQRPMRLRGSSPVVGSSRKRTGGRATSAAARSRRRRIPPE